MAGIVNEGLIILLDSLFEVVKGLDHAFIRQLIISKDANVFVLHAHAPGDLPCGFGIVLDPGELLDAFTVSADGHD